MSPKIKMDIDMGNAAFEHMAGAEVARILRHLADRIADCPMESLEGCRLHDINGNFVGRFDVYEGE